MKEHSDKKSEAREGCRGKQQGFKKKNGKHKKPQSMAKELFRGLGFCIGREVPELYAKTLEKLGLYVSTQFENGADVKKMFDAEETGKAKYNWTSREPHGTREMSMGVPYYEKWKDSQWKSMQLICSADVTMWLWHEESSRKQYRVYCTIEEAELYRSTLYYQEAYIDRWH